MARQFRCRFTVTQRCQEVATVKLRLTYSIVSTPQVTRVCQGHALSLAEMCLAADVKFERI